MRLAGAEQLLGTTLPWASLLMTVPVQVPLATTCAFTSLSVPGPVSMAPLLNTFPWIWKILLDFWAMPTSPGLVPSVSSAWPGLFAEVIGTAPLAAPVPGPAAQVTVAAVPSARGKVRLPQDCPAALL